MYRIGVARFDAVDHVRSKLGLIAEQHVFVAVAIVAVASSSTADSGWRCDYRWRSVDRGSRSGCGTGGDSGRFTSTSGRTGGKEDLRLGR